MCLNILGGLSVAAATATMYHHWMNERTNETILLCARHLFVNSLVRIAMLLTLFCVTIHFIAEHVFVFFTFTHTNNIRTYLILDIRKYVNN